jgi:hypothetical protein
MRTLVSAPKSTGKGARAKLCNLLPDRLRLREQQQVIWSTGFRICARHIEAAEGMRPDNCASALAVDVKIANVEVAHRAVNFVFRLRIDAAGETEFGIVGDFQSVIEITRLDHRQDWTKNFFLLQL